MSDEASIEDKKSSDFIREQIYFDLKSGNCEQIVTRFPPEPNGYLHIGHALSICLNFGIAEEVNGICNLRFDDTNPAKEELEFIKSIEEDVRWLGFDWSGQTKYASDNFHQFFEWAVYLIKKTSLTSTTSQRMKFGNIGAPLQKLVGIALIAIDPLKRTFKFFMI